MGGRRAASCCDLGQAGLLWKSVLKLRFRALWEDVIECLTCGQWVACAASAGTKVRCDNQLTVSGWTVATNPWHTDGAACILAFQLSSSSSTASLKERSFLLPAPSSCLVGFIPLWHSRLCKVNRLLSIEPHDVSDRQYSDQLLAVTLPLCCPLCFLELPSNSDLILQI